MSACDRCGREAFATIGSFFNTESICLDCEKAEQAHPAYAEAKRIEEDHVRQGDFNFPGVGLPDDLRGGGW